MKLLWLDLNSSYAHSSLALPALHAQIADDTTVEWCMVSATIKYINRTLMGINGKIVVRCIQEKYSAETKSR